jgi:hypothetical protein
VVSFRAKTPLNINDTISFLNKFLSSFFFMGFYLKAHSATSPIAMSPMCHINAMPPLVTSSLCHINASQCWFPHKRACQIIQNLCTPIHLHTCTTHAL